MSTIDNSEMRTVLWNEAEKRIIEAQSLDRDVERLENELERLKFRAAELRHIGDAVRQAAELLAPVRTGDD